MSDQPPKDVETPKQVIDYRDLGQTGLRRFSGFIYEEFLTELTGWKGIAIYKEMSSNDPTVGAMLFAIQMLCRRVPWRVQPASTQPMDVEAADFLETCMNDMSHTWTDGIVEALSMLTYGHSLHEIVYKRRAGNSEDPSMRSQYCDGRIGWRKMPIRSQDTLYRWEFDAHGGIQGVEQMAPPHYNHVLIPVEKFLLFRTTVTKNNPEGVSILRNAYRPWYMKKNIENIEGIGVERDLAGLPVIYAPSELFSANASQDEKNVLSSLKNLAINIRRDEQEGVVMPNAMDPISGKPLYELKLLSTGGSRQFDTDKIVNRYDKRIAMTAMADFILMGQENVGSFALASSKTGLFTTAIGAYLDIIADVYNRYAVRRLFALHDFKITDYPQIMHGDLESVDLKEMGDYIQKLAQAGMPLFPNPELEKYLLKAASLPEAVEEVADQALRIQNSAPSMGKNFKEIPADPTDKPVNTQVPADTTPKGAPESSEITTNDSGDAESNSARLIAAEIAADLENEM